MTEEIAGRRVEYEVPWLSVEAKDVVRDDSTTETFYSVRTHDYAAVLAVTEAGLIPLVRQFRPAIEERSLELPSGLIEPGEEPEQTARRELLEEVGCAVERVQLIGQFDMDSGRMQTREYAFFAPDVRVVGEPTGDEPGLEVVFVTSLELRRYVQEGQFRMAGHLAVLASAFVRGLLP
jgi:ADP-ribose pyrophosphatase